MARASRGSGSSCWASVSGHTVVTHILARMLDRLGVPTRHVSVLDAGRLEFDLDLEDPSIPQRSLAAFLKGSGYAVDLGMILCARSTGALPFFESYYDEDKPPTIH